MMSQMNMKHLHLHPGYQPYLAILLHPCTSQVMKIFRQKSEVFVSTLSTSSATSCLRLLQESLPSIWSWMILSGIHLEIEHHHDHNSWKSSKSPYCTAAILPLLFSEVILNRQIRCETSEVLIRKSIFIVTNKFGNRVIRYGGYYKWGDK